MAPTAGVMSEVLADETLLIVSYLLCALLFSANTPLNQNAAERDLLDRSEM
jgi:hypothetical protein